MNVLIYLYYPFFDTHLAGGVQVWLRYLIPAIQRQNKDIHFSIYCPRSALYNYPSDLEVHPVLCDLERDFIPLNEVKQTLHILEEAAENADLIWLIDRNFPVFTDKPKLLSLNTVCYEREIMSVFQSGWKYMTVPSLFIMDMLKNIVSIDKVVQIAHYIDPIFLSADADRKAVLNKYFKYDTHSKYLLSPHRPDPTKGHEEAVLILKELLLEDNRYRLLIPCPPDAKLANVDSERKYIEKLHAYISEHGLEDKVIFHKWIEYNDLPYYYAAGQATLFLSRLPETFGLSLLNSAACGTPTISFGVGALPEVVPEGPLHHIVAHWEDAVSYILMKQDSRKIDSCKNALIQKYELEHIAGQYVEVFYKCLEVN